MTFSFQTIVETYFRCHLL